MDIFEEVKSAVLATSPTLELSKDAFAAALKDTLEAGKELERQRIIDSLNADAVLQMNLSAQWLGYIVGMIEDVQ